MPVTYSYLNVTTGFYSWINTASVIDTGFSGSSLTASFNTDGTVTFTTSVGDTLIDNIDHWHIEGTVAGIGNSRWAKRTFVSGTALTGTLGTSLTALSEARTLSIEATAANVSGTVLIEIYSDAAGTIKVGQITITLSAAYAATVATVGTVETVVTVGTVSPETP